jgi:hypothetical protein
LRIFGMSTRQSIPRTGSVRARRGTARRGASPRRCWRCAGRTCRGALILERQTPQPSDHTQSDRPWSVELPASGSKRGAPARKTWKALRPSALIALYAGETLRVNRGATAYHGERGPQKGSPARGCEEREEEKTAPRAELRE